MALNAAGRASITTTDTTVTPSATVTAQFNPSTPNFTSSTGTTVLTIQKAMPNFVLSATSTSNSLPHSGGSFTLTATATSSFAGAIPTGTVTFSDGGRALGAAALNASGVAIIVVTLVGAGLHTIQAAYAGDSCYDPAITFASVVIPASFNFSAIIARIARCERRLAKKKRRQQGLKLKCTAVNLYL